MRKSEIVVFCIVVLSFIIGAYFYPQLPDKIASHWNTQGSVDGYMPKLLGVFLLPLILIGICLLFFIIPKIDPLKNNIGKFKNYYEGFIVLFSVFMLSVYMQLILWNIGIELSPNFIFPIGIGILFFYIGILCENSKRNWFIGIRTPWTLSNDKIWDKTNKLGGKLFKLAGIISIIGVFFHDYALLFVIVPVILVAVFTAVYSYVEYRKVK